VGVNFALSHYVVRCGPGCPAPYNTDEHKGKTVIITGANTGIGRTTAEQFARWGARVILACRDEGKGNKTASELIASTGNSAIEVHKLDLSSFNSVRLFAKKWGDQKIDILINNAGIMFCPYALTEDGFESQFGSNHLGHFLLTNLLLPNLKKVKLSRVINVSSLGHALAPKTIPWTNLSDTSLYSPVKAYGWSKLANVYFTRELARRYEGVIISTSLHPGGVRTELARHITGINKYVLEALALVYFKTPTEGAQTSLYCATQAVHSGSFYADCKELETTAQGKDMEEAAKLWDISTKLVGL